MTEHDPGSEPDPLINTALQQWGLQNSPYTLIAARENQVFRVETPTQPRALRLHRKGYRARTEILSELQWMAMLSDGGLPLPSPCPTLNGELCITIDGTHISVVSWLDGIPLGQHGQLAPIEQPELAFRTLGKTMAQLHELSDQWTPPADFNRPAWHVGALLGDNPLWGRFWENPELTPEQSQRLLYVRDLAREQLVELAPSLDYGLIHADLIPDNVLIHHGKPQPIDFDDGGFGFRLFDLATTINRAWRDDNSGSLANAVLEGYQSERIIDLTPLPLFRAVRSFTYLGWISSRLNEPGASERCRRYRDLALQWAAQIIDNNI